MREVNITKWKGIKIKQNNYYGTKEVGSSQIRRGPEEERAKCTFTERDGTIRQEARKTQ